MVKFLRAISVIISLILVSLEFWSCDDNEEPCAKCGEIQTTFDHKFFSVFIEDPDTFLVQHDTVEEVSTFFSVCNPQLLESLVSGNVVEVSGSFKRACNNADLTKIDIQELTWVSSCLPAIPELDGLYSLDNVWFIQYIQTKDTTVYTPCEGPSVVEFDTSEQNIKGVVGANWFHGTGYTVLNDSMLMMPQDFAVSLAVGNRSQAYFESEFHDVIKPKSIITYSIEKNILIIKNTADNSLVRLFIAE